MKKAILLAAAVGASLLCNAFFVVTRATNGIATYQSSDIENIVLNEEGGATVNLANGNTVAISPEEFVSIGFDENMSGIKDAANESAFTVVDNEIQSTDGTALTVYALDGTIIGEGSINVTQMPAGVFILKNSEGKSTKILLQ